MDPDYGPEAPPEPEPVMASDVLSDEEVAELTLARRKAAVRFWLTTSVFR